MNTTSPQRERIDWSQLWNPGPVRVFTAEELERAGGDAPSRTLPVMVNLIAALSFLSLLQAAPPPDRMALGALVAIWSIGLLGVGWLAASCIALPVLANARLRFLTVWRSDLFAARLRELHEHERAIEWPLAWPFPKPRDRPCPPPP